MIDKMIIEKKSSKNETCESGKTKNIEKTEFTNGSSSKCVTFVRKFESVYKNNSKRNKKRNKKIAPILNICIEETLLRFDVNVYEALISYYTKG